MASITPSNSDRSRKVSTPTSGGIITAEAASKKTRRAFGGKPVHQRKKTTPLLWLVKGLFTPFTKREEETGEDESDTMTSFWERKIGHGETERSIATSAPNLKNVAWNRKAFDFVRALSLDNFGTESFNQLLGDASALLCQIPPQGNQLNVSLSNALAYEASRLPAQDREAVLQNIQSFKPELLRTAKETGPLYETSSDGLIPNGQFATLVDQMLTHILVRIHPVQETKE